MQTPLRHKLSAAGTALLCATLLGIGVAAHAADLKSGLKIAFVPKQINNPYEVIADDGGMAAITNELMYEVLKSIQAQVAIVREDMDSMKTRLTALDGRFDAPPFIPPPLGEPGAVGAVGRR